MKGCGRLDPFTVIIYHLGLFFSPPSQAASSKKDGNIGRRGVQEVKYRQELMCHLGAQMRCHTRPAGRPVSIKLIQPNVKHQGDLLTNLCI